MCIRRECALAPFIGQAPPTYMCTINIYLRYHKDVPTRLFNSCCIASISAPLSFVALQGACFLLACGHAVVLLDCTDDRDLSAHVIHSTLIYMQRELLR